MKFRSIEVVELIQFVSVSSYNTGKLYTHGDYLYSISWMLFQLTDWYYNVHAGQSFEFIRDQLFPVGKRKGIYYL